MICPVCQSSNQGLFDQDKQRSYYFCHECSLVFVPRELCLTAELEKNRYNAHKNDENDPLYQQYFQQIVNAIHPYLASHMRGLDFGCGRTKLLEHLFAKKKVSVQSYDLYFYPDEVLVPPYDFIILSEVIEHLRDPHQIMEDLAGQLRPGGSFFIKTKFYPPSSSDFKQWFYKRDQTHIQFFNEKSMNAMAQKLKCDVFQTIGEDLYCLKLQQ